MKRSLILFSLIVFVTVSCAGPTVYRREEWVISLDKFEKDRKECIESIDKDPNLETYDKAFEECFEKKGYESKTSRNVGNQTALNVFAWARWMKSQDQFEKDRKECIDSIDKNLDSEAFGKALEECLEKDGYEFKKAEEPRSGKKLTAKDIGLIALVIVLSPLILAYAVWRIGTPP
jgi:hypothetical protein